jgi:hypothetical protein
MSRVHEMMTGSWIGNEKRHACAIPIEGGLLLISAFPPFGIIPCLFSMGSFHLHPTVSNLQQVVLHVRHPAHYDWIDVMSLSVAAATTANRFEGSLAEMFVSSL